jgi:hypothetical protein
MTVGPVAAGGRSSGVFDALAGAGIDYRLCARGKGALAAALDLLDAGGNVLLPAAVPAGVPGAVRAAGAEPRFYRVRGDLQPAYADLLRRADRDTDALVVVHYFGVPQPRTDDLLALADAAGVPVVEDNSHAALSRRNGRLLGTEGTVGFTSLHKTLPVPNGAVLYGRGVDLPDAGAPEWSRADLRFCARRAFAALPSLPSPRSGLPGTGDDDRADDAADPAAIHERNREPLSPLTPPLLARIDPGAVVERRRAGYRRWATRLEGVAGVAPLFDALPDGACPWAFPAVCADPDRVRAALGGRGFGWPRLPPAVDGAPDYPAANACARRLVALPVGVERATIDRLADRLIAP